MSALMLRVPLDNVPPLLVRNFSMNALIDYLRSIDQNTNAQDQIDAILDNEIDLSELILIDNASTSLLHLAASKGNIIASECLLRAGHSWNMLDSHGQSVGDVALKGGFRHLYDFFVEEACRTEFLLTALGIPGNDSGVEKSVSNSEYLQSKLVYSNDQLLDESKNGVMMGWETPLMKVHADIICPRDGLRILNVGFGLGIIDLEIQQKKPASHTIIEAHPDVYRKMIQDGWDKIEGVKIIFGRWQDVLDQLEVYDGIFFDTFGEFYDDLKEFHDHLPNILDEKGIYSYFNGLAGTNMFFHDVACKISECDLSEIGMSIEYKTINVQDLGQDVWNGIKRAYWTLPQYKAPIGRLLPMECLDR